MNRSLAHQWGNQSNVCQRNQGRSHHSCSPPPSTNVQARSTASHFQPIRRAIPAVSVKAARANTASPHPSPIPRAIHDSACKTRRPFRVHRSAHVCWVALCSDRVSLVEERLQLIGCNVVWRDIREWCLAVPRWTTVGEIDDQRRLSARVAPEECWPRREVLRNEFGGIGWDGRE